MIATAAVSGFEHFVQEELQRLARRLTAEHQRLLATSQTSHDFEYSLSEEPELLHRHLRSTRLGVVAPAATGETPAESGGAGSDHEHHSSRQAMVPPSAVFDHESTPRTFPRQSPRPSHRGVLGGKGRGGGGGGGPGTAATGVGSVPSAHEDTADRLSAVENEVLRLHAALSGMRELLESRLPAAGLDAAAAPTLRGEEPMEPARRTSVIGFPSMRQRRASKLGRKSVFGLSPGGNWTKRIEEETCDELLSRRRESVVNLDAADPVLPREVADVKSRPSSLPTADLGFGGWHSLSSEVSERRRPQADSGGDVGYSSEKSSSAYSQYNPRVRCPVSTVSPQSRPSTLSEASVSQASEASQDQAGRQSYELLSHWTGELNREKAARSQSGVLQNEAEEVIAVDEHLAKPAKGWVLGPKSMPRLAWDSAGTILIAYDLFAVPLGFLSFPETIFTTVMSWVTRLFWTFDIVASFFTGYTLDTGELTLRLYDIASRYLRTWLLVDVLLVSMDWLQALNRQADNTGRVMRMLRIFRMMRLVRLARMMFVMQMTSERIRSEKVATLANIAMIVALILGVTHVIACMWFAMGDARSDGWVRATGYDEEERWLQYAVSLHWSLTQFTGTMDLEPQNLPERFFAVATLLFAFVIASWFVSSITSSMTRLHIISRKQSVQFLMLRRFLFENGISQRLMARLQRNARHALALRSRHLAEVDVELLGIVAEPLRVELHFEIHWPKLEIHPLFARYGRESPEAVRRVCHIAVCALVFEKGDVLFDAGEIPLKRRMLFPWEGLLSYSLQTCAPVGSARSSLFSGGAKTPGAWRGSGRLSAVSPLPVDPGDACGVIDLGNGGTGQGAGNSGAETEAGPIAIGPGNWLCEPVLWTHWRYRGHLQASSDCQLIAIDGCAFEEVAAQTPTFDVARYALLFVRELNDSIVDISDVGDYATTMSIISRSYGSSRKRTQQLSRYEDINTNSDMPSASRSSSAETSQPSSASIDAQGSRVSAFSNRAARLHLFCRSCVK